MKKLYRRLGVAVTGTFVLGLAGPVLANDAGGEATQEETTQEEVTQEEEEGRSTIEVMLDRVAEQAAEAGVPVDDVLGTLFEGSLPDGDGGLEQVTGTLEDALRRIAGDTSVADEDDEGDNEGDNDGAGGTGFAGTPRTNAGNIMHVAANVEIHMYGEPHPLLGIPVIPRSEDPEVPDAPYPYDVVESEWTPDTPIVPGINPFLLSGLVAPELADLDPGLPPILAMHWGGRLTNVQGGDWSLLGAHSAGTTPIGSSVDTTDRSDDEDARWPFYVPGIDPINIAGVAELEGDQNPLEEGDLLVPDTAIDFLGFAQVVNEGSCERVSVNIPLTQLKSVTDICFGVGLILGDGVSFFDGEGPIDFRSDLAPLWEPVPEELAPVFEAVDEVVGSVPVDEIVETILDAAGGDLLPGDEPGEPGDDDDEDEDEDTDLGPLHPVLKGLNRLVP